MYINIQTYICIYIYFVVFFVIFFDVGIQISCAAFIVLMNVSYISCISFKHIHHISPSFLPSLLIPPPSLPPPPLPSYPPSSSPSSPSPSLVRCKSFFYTQCPTPAPFYIFCPCLSFRYLLNNYQITFNYLLDIGKFFESCYFL